MNEAESFEIIQYFHFFGRITRSALEKDLRNSVDPNFTVQFSADYRNNPTVEMPILWKDTRLATIVMLETLGGKIITITVAPHPTETLPENLGSRLEKFLDHFSDEFGCLFRKRSPSTK